MLTDLCAVYIEHSSSLRFYFRCRAFAVRRDRRVRRKTCDTVTDRYGPAPPPGIQAGGVERGSVPSCVWRSGTASPCVACDSRSSERVYLPASVVLQVLSWALSVDLHLADHVLASTIRAAVATVFTFCFFARGATGAALLSEHVRRGPQGELLITLEHEKGKAKRARVRLLTIPAGSVPGLDELLAKWEAFRGPACVGDSYYALPSDRSRRVRFASSQIDGWLQLVLLRFGISPPAGETWSGHSLRKGAASAASAVGVALDRICWCGGWSIHGSVVHDYIDPTCPSDVAAYRFFGWLLPAAMRA